MAKKRVSQVCDCVNQVNKRLEDSNCQIKTQYMMNLDTGAFKESPPLIALEKLKPSRKPLPTMVCSYCPFCGKKFK